MDKQYGKVRIFVDLNIVELSFYRAVPFHSGKFPFSIAGCRKIKKSSLLPVQCREPHSNNATPPPHPKHFRALATDFLRAVPTPVSTVIGIVVVDFVFNCDHFPEIWEPRSFFSIEIQIFSGLTLGLFGLCMRTLGYRQWFGSPTAGRQSIIRSYTYCVHTCLPPLGNLLLSGCCVWAGVKRCKALES